MKLLTHGWTAGQFRAAPPQGNSMSLIDLGDCYFDSELKPTVKYDSDGNVEWMHYCPYIPKFLFDGADIGFDSFG